MIYLMLSPVWSFIHTPIGWDGTCRLYTPWWLSPLRLCSHHRDRWGGGRWVLRIEGTLLTSLGVWLVHGGKIRLSYLKERIKWTLFPIELVSLKGLLRIFQGFVQILSRFYSGPATRATAPSPARFPLKRHPAFFPPSIPNRWREFVYY
jgi:hypothetical protein